MQKAPLPAQLIKTGSCRLELRHGIGSPLGRFFRRLRRFFGIARGRGIFGIRRGKHGRAAGYVALRRLLLLLPFRFQSLGLGLKRGYALFQRRHAPGVHNHTVALIAPKAAKFTFRSLPRALLVLQRRRLG